MSYDPIVTDGKPPQRNWVHFYHRTLKNEALSAEAGRPIFEQVEYIRICIPGDKTLEVDKRATDDHRVEYEPEHKRFLANESQEAARGTPLELLGLRPERVAEYAYHKVATVEQLASVTDGNVQGLGMGVTAERQKARDYLEVMKGDASLTKMRSELASRDAEMASMRADLAALKAERNAPKQKQGA